ncbi:11000_t:CDS:2 [Funneliformis caledonium]|uniref:11000_t:CDS:1 n=1 Tax=Funneliformis caledonium TaxID=1117310 RepID=A0A9N9CZG1_9GLOM|nr:11000_t:CDS:2 [Funneliformis caledonium]
MFLFSSFDQLKLFTLMEGIYANNKIMEMISNLNLVDFLTVWFRNGSMQEDVDDISKNERLYTQCVTV